MDYPTKAKSHGIEKLSYIDNIFSSIFPSCLPSSITVCQPLDPKFTRQTPTAGKFFTNIALDA